MVLERADVFATRGGGGEQILVAARARDELAEDGEELPAVAVTHEENAVAGLKRAPAVKRQRPREPHGPLDPGGVVVLARPGEVGRVDAGAAREGIDVGGREVRHVAEDAGDLRAGEAANRASDPGEDRERVVGHLRDRERVIPHERAVREEDEPDVRRPHPVTHVEHFALPLGRPLGRPLGADVTRIGSGAGSGSGCDGGAISAGATGRRRYASA